MISNSLDLLIRQFSLKNFLANSYKVSWQAINAWKHSGTIVQEKQPVAEVQIREEPENLELENQILKKKIELLTKEFSRLKKAITDLTEIVE